MNITFHLNYNTAFGEELLLSVLAPQAGEAGVRQYRMSTLDGREWTFTLKKDFPLGSALTYFYSVERDGKQLRKEHTAQMHRLEMNNKKAESLNVFDLWRDNGEDSYLYCSAFTECLIGRQPEMVPIQSFDAMLRIKVLSPTLPKDSKLYLTGEGKLLGSWQRDKALAMYQHQKNEWICDISLSPLDKGYMQYKFFAITPTGEQIWENSDNRTVLANAERRGDVRVVEAAPAVFGGGRVRVAGTLVPVFSLRSKQSFGVGDFQDLKRMVDFVALTGQKVLQILPVNDTTSTHTWQDSYPYSCISVFALHPQYAALGLLPAVKDKTKREAFEKERQEINVLEQIDYERANGLKLRYLQEIYKQEGTATLQSGEFREFFKENARWLVPYAQFCSLRDKNQTADFSLWQGNEEFHEEDRERLSSPKSKEFKAVAFHYYVQFVLASQLRQVHSYARQKGVVLKGDIPIGVSRYGADVWQDKRYFNLNGQAGAPPDDFSVNGQNWGFPTYNWQEMLKDGCLWWKLRFENMAKYFDAYRIDHVLGFFRIWEIPENAVHGLLGQFSPALGMTRDEIEAYGLSFQEGLFLEPFIMDWVLERVFKDRANEVKAKYLEPREKGFYRMKPQYDTQKKVEKAFLGVKDREELNIRDGLYALISDVLFLRDRENRNLYHPRISAQFNFIYEWLYDSDKAIFNRLYNDYFYKRNNNFWYLKAKEKLPLLVGATNMLVCAEDLGMVPDCVPWLMGQERILSLEIQSMPKDPSVAFGILERNPYLSVATISTHDMPTLRQWWDEDWPRTQRYYNQMLRREGPAPHPLPSYLAREIVENHLKCPSMLCVLSVQDWLSVDDRLRLRDANKERINIPANPHHYWRYRMHLRLEDMLRDMEFVNNISDLIQRSGR